MLPELTCAGWLLLCTATLLIGFAKTAIGGVAAVAVVIFALVLPARESTGALLPLLLCGDVLAIRLYRRHASWPILLRLIPGVVPGLLLGAWFVDQADDTLMGRSIGLILLAMTVLQLWQRRYRVPAPVDGTLNPALTFGTGAVAGFATMTANAGGPVMTLYLVMAGLPVLGMLGTGAWFFLMVNLAKVPLSASLDLITLPGLAMDAVLMPAMVLGAWLGVVAIRRIDQVAYERIAVALAGISSVILVFTV